MIKKLNYYFFLQVGRKNKYGKSPLYLRFTYNGKRESISTGIAIQEHLWDNTKQVITGSNDEANIQNVILNELKTRLLSIYAELTRQKKEVSALILRNRLTKTDADSISLLTLFVIHNKEVRSQVNTVVSQATATKYETLLSKVRSFLKGKLKTEDVALTELRLHFVYEFENYLRVDEQIGHNSTVKYIQFLKKVINYAIRKEWIDKSPFDGYKCRFKPVNRIALTQSEIKKLESLVFSTKRLEIVRDVFVFSCYTGIAYSDVKELTMDEVQTGQDGNQWILTNRAKTQTRVSVPLLPNALTLISKYEPWRTRKDVNLVFPIPSNQKTNEYLKEIAELAGINKPLSFHLARHTFATVALTKGVPIESVSKMLGHTRLSTTQIYAKIVDSKLAEDMKKFQDGLE